MNKEINIEITLSKMLDESLEEAARNNRRKKIKKLYIDLLNRLMPKVRCQR